MPRLLIAVLALATALATVACNGGPFGGGAATPTPAAGTTPVAPVAQPTPTLSQGRLVVNVLPAGPQVQLAGAQCTVLGPDGRTVQMAGRAGAAGTPAPAGTPGAVQDPARINVAVEHRGQELTLDCQLTMEPRGAAATPAAGTTPAPGGAGRRVTTTDNVNLRQSASTTATVITVVPSGTQLTVTAEQRVGDITWLQVTFNNQQGWIAGTFTR